MSAEPFKDIDIDQFKEQFTDPDAYVLVDVREEHEYDEGFIPGAVNFPLSTFQSDYDEIETGKPIVLVCARGGRSAMAADFLAAQGIENLYNLTEGTMGWMMRGLPLDEPDA